MHGYDVRLELFAANALTNEPVSRARGPRNRPGAAVPEAELLARIAEIDASRCRRIVLAGGFDPMRHPAFERVAKRCREAGIPSVVLEASGSAFAGEGAVDRATGAGVTAAMVVVSAVRERVYEATMHEVGAFSDAMRGLAALAASELSAHAVVPLSRPNAADVVPLVEWLLELPGGLDGVLLFVPSLTRLSVEQRASTLDDSSIAALAAGAFEACRRRGVEYGFVEQRGVSPCARTEALDPFATVFVQHLRNRREIPPEALTRVAACADCSLHYACAGMERAYVQTHGEAELSPVTLERSTAWRLKRIHGLEEHDYKNISAFDNDRPGRGRSLVRVNGHCQMACAFCFVDRTVPDYGTEELKAEIRALAEQQTDHLVLSGGEPSLHPELEALIAHARELGFSTIEIQTNAVKSAELAYAQRLVDAGLTKATVSLHSTDPDRSDEITKMRGAFPRTLEGLKNFRRLGVETQIAHVITKANYRELPETVRFLRRELPASGGHLSVCFAIAQGISDLVYTWTIPRFEEVEPFFREALDLCLEGGIGFGGMIGQGGYPPCMLGGDLRYYRHNFDNVYRSADYAEQFYKSPRCAECSFDPYCIGVRRDYVKTYGDDEIRPFRCDEAELSGLTPLPPSSADRLEGHMPREKLTPLRRSR